MKNHKIVCIVGPTASGKTAMGVEMATQFNGEIISADSRQVYRQLNIGTNKEGKPKVRTQNSPVSAEGQAEVGKLKSPTCAEASAGRQNYNSKLKIIKQNSRYINDIPQRLIDICKPGDEFTVFDWLERARIVIEDIFQRGKLPIVVGGTGLYVQSLVEGFEQTQSSKLKCQNYNSKLKTYSREELDKKSLEELRMICSKLEAVGSKLDSQNPRRLIRAIERAQEGICVMRKKPNFDALQIGIDIPRSVLYKKIDKKVEDWFSSGIIEEVRKLLASGVSSNWLKKIGLNYGLITEYLESSDDRVDKLKKEIKFKTHAYARRQLTWFRRFPEINWIKDKKGAEKIVSNFLR